MADEGGSSPSQGDKTEDISPAADVVHLRKVEVDVLIPKMIREKAKVICKDHVDALVACAKGRTISMMWACRQENKKMKDCLLEAYDNKDLQEQCRVEYLRGRDEFEKS